MLSPQPLLKMLMLTSVVMVVVVVVWREREAACRGQRLSPACSQKRPACLSRQVGMKQRSGVDPGA
jgi:hypothetical protein